MKKLALPLICVFAFVFSFTPTNVAAQAAYEKFMKDLNADYDEAELKLEISLWATDSIQKKEYAPVIDVLSKAIKKFPDFFSFHFLRGAAYAGSEANDPAVADFSKIITLAPENPLGYSMRGAVLVKKAQYDAAIADFTRQINLKPQDLKAAHAQRANAYILKGDHLGAVDDWASALKLSSLGYGIHESHIQAHTKSREFAAAIAEMDKLLRLLPDNRMLFLDRGNLHFENGKADAAIADYTKAISLDPSKESAYVLRARAYAAKKDLTSAIADYGKAIQADPKSVTTYAERGRLHQLARNWPAAVTDYTSVIDTISKYSQKMASTPGMAVYYTERGISYLGIDVQKAEADLNKAIQLNPKGSRAFWVRSGIFCQSNRKDLAKQDEAQVIALGGKLDRTCAAAAAEIKTVPIAESKPAAPTTAKGWFDKGEQHMEDRDLRDAVAAFTKAIALKTGYSEAYGRRAVAHFADMGQTEGFADINKAITLDPTNHEFYAVRAGFYCFRHEAAADPKALALAKRDEAKVLQLGGKVERPCK
jgi:tetratricopeptide (TPR) repeat protein